MTMDRAKLLDALVHAMPAWQVRASQYNDVVATRLGIATSDLQCLFALHRDGPSTPGALAERLGLTTGSASRMVDRLVAAGLVSRIPDPHDRRRMIVTIQRRAARRLLAHYDPLDDALRELLDQFPATALRHFLTFMEEAAQTTADLSKPS